MKKQLLLLLLLLAGQVHAECTTFTFESPPVPAQQFQSLSPTGFAMWPGSATTLFMGWEWWRRSESAPGQDGMFTNQPSGEHAMYHSPCPFGPGCQFFDYVIGFDPPVYRVTFRYTGRFYMQWQVSPTAIAISPASLPVRVYFYSDWYYHSSYFASVYSPNNPATDTGVNHRVYANGWTEGQNVSCTGDEFCNWLEYTYESTEPISMLWIATEGGPYSGTWSNQYALGGYNGFWLDGLTACTTAQGCPDPPCGFERAELERGEGATPAQRTSWGRVKAIYR